MFILRISYLLFGPESPVLIFGPKRMAWSTSKKSHHCHYLNFHLPSRIWPFLYLFRHLWINYATGFNWWTQKIYYCFFPKFDCHSNIIVWDGDFIFWAFRPSFGWEPIFILLRFGFELYRNFWPLTKSILCLEVFWTFHRCRLGTYFAQNDFWEFHFQIFV